MAKSKTKRSTSKQTSTRGGARPGSGRRARRVARKPFTMRLPVQLMDDLDELAQDLCMSRTAIIERVMSDLVRASKEEAKDSTLFDELRVGIEQQFIERVMNEVRDVISRPTMQLMRRPSKGEKKGGDE